MKFKHEDFLLDLDTPNKAKLYKEGKLQFMGDGYRAITILMRNSKDSTPVREHFHAQLTMREKPKFSANDEMDKLRKEAYLEEEKRKSQAKGKKK